MSRAAPWLFVLLVVVGGCSGDQRGAAPAVALDPASAPVPAPSATASGAATSPKSTTTTTTTLVVTDEARAQAQRGELPPGPEVDVIAAKCAICHTTQYLTMQRLTPPQWEKTLKKMKGWGAPINEVELAQLQRYLGAYFTPALPAPAVVVVAAPPGSMR